MEHDLKRYAAHQLREHGYHPVLLRGKRPFLKDWQTPMEQREIGYWLGRYRDLNIGVLLTGQGLAVIDVDNPEDAWVKEKQTLIEQSPQICLSSRGRHAYFRVEGDVPGRTLPGGDLKTRGAVVAPPSEHPETGWTYRWRSGIVRKDLLPLLPAGLLEQPGREARQPVIVRSTDLDGVRAYVSHIVARNHAGGHNQAFRCAVKIAERVSDFAAAMALYREWNLTNAVDTDGTTPCPFSEKELLHKMTDAWKAVRRT